MYFRYGSHIFINMHTCACICASNIRPRWLSVLCKGPNYSLYHQSLSTHREFQKKCINENSLVEEYLASFKKKKKNPNTHSSQCSNTGMTNFQFLLLPFTYISTDLQSHTEIREYQISVANTCWDFTILQILCYGL